MAHEAEREAEVHLERGAAGGPLHGEPALGSEAQALAGKLTLLFQPLAPQAQGVAVQLYRLLARGEAVAPQALARAAGVTTARVEALLGGWFGVQREGAEIVGYRGLTARPVSAHRMVCGQSTLYGWCAWDTLFLPEILGEPAEVDSRDPETGEPVRLTVTPRGVTRMEPAQAVISFVTPRAEMTEDLTGRFCRYIHFFASPDSGRRWTARHPGTVLLSIGEAFALGRLRNQRHLGDALEAAGAAGHAATQSGER